jgi:RNA polymerase sigma factor (sigma-70 family)
MDALHDRAADGLKLASSPPIDLAVHQTRKTRTMLRSRTWERQSAKWDSLMFAAQRGESESYERLIFELDIWLRRYYACRLPQPAADDARQDTLLAVHARRHSYIPLRPFGAWVAAIARNKWVDRVREAARFSALSPQDEVSIADHSDAIISAIVIDDLLGRLKPAQARAIRLVKLEGASIESASNTTGQSAALIKVNIHRGLKELAAFVAYDAELLKKSAKVMPRSRLTNVKRREIAIDLCCAAHVARS